LRFKIVYLSLLLVIFTFKNVGAQPYKLNSLNKLLSNTSNNKKLTIAYRASELFHEILNDYRIKNGLNELKFNHVLWLTSRNHNLWMSENGLSHTESVKSKNFTGANPGDRVNYVNKNSCSWSGENCLYNFSYNELDSIELSAYNIAEESFNQWKESTGHNKNMLGQHSYEGTAFLITDVGVVWATSLFGFCEEPIILNSPNKKLLSSSNSSQEKKLTNVYNALNTRKQINNLLSIKYQHHNLSRKNYLQSTALLYTNQINNCKSISKNKSDFKKRLLKASNGLSLIYRFENYNEFNFCKEYFFDANFNDDVESDVDNWLADIDFINDKFYGHSLKVIKRDERIIVVISIVSI
jgi:uncharacterized protein YkwD